MGLTLGPLVRGDRLGWLLPGLLLGFRVVGALVGWTDVESTCLGLEDGAALGYEDGLPVEPVDSEPGTQQAPKVDSQASVGMA